MTQKQLEKKLDEDLLVCAICLTISAIIYGITIHKTIGWRNVINDAKDMLNSRKEINMDEV